MWQVVSGREVTPHGPTITSLPLTTRLRGELWHKHYTYINEGVDPNDVPEFH